MRDKGDHWKNSRTQNTFLKKQQNVIYCLTKTIKRLSCQEFHAILLFFVIPIGFHKGKYFSKDSLVFLLEGQSYTRMKGPIHTFQTPLKCNLSF